MASIKIPTPLRVYTDNEAKVTVDGATVQEALSNLVTIYPELNQHLFADGKLRNFVNVFLGDEDIRFLDGVDTELESDADLRIIPSIAGGL
jgi:molybdopterin converting factor small subunit